MTNNNEFSELSLSVFRRLDNTNSSLCVTDKFVYWNMESSSDYFDSPNLTYCIDFSFAGLYCLSGVFNIEINHSVVSLEEGCFCLLKRNDLVRLASDNKSFHCICIMLQNPDMALAVNNTQFLLHVMTFLDNGGHVFRLPQKSFEVMSSIMDSMNYILKHDNFLYKNEVLQNCLSIIFYSSFADLQLNNLDQTVNNRKDDIFKEFLKLLSVHYKNCRQVSDYASMMCITPKYLSTVVHDVSGKFARDIISEYVIVEAKRLLKNSSMSVKEICSNLNFVNPSFFCKYFKQHTSQTPQNFRKNTI